MIDQVCGYGISMSKKYIYLYIYTEGVSLILIKLYKNFISILYSWEVEWNEYKLPWDT